MRLLIIRHADPDYPNRTITAAGHREAAALAERFAHEPVDRIFASPLGRAVHTAKPTAEALNLPIEIEPWCAELNALRMTRGPQVGTMAWDLHGEVIRLDPAAMRAGRWWTLPPFDDPVFRDEVERVGRDSDAFLAKLGYEREDGRYRITRPTEQRIAVFCHGGLGLTWLAHLLELPLALVWSGFWLPPTSITTVLFDERSVDWATPRCLHVGDTGHLHAAGLPVAPAGIKANFV
jgi:probable phosphoglycerate mutase